MFFQHPFVIVLLIALPGYCYGRTSPKKPTKSSTKRSYVGHSSVCTLHVPHGLQIPAQKLGNGCHIGSGSREYRNVTCPSEPFVSLRAVCWYWDEISECWPRYVAPQLVDELRWCFILSIYAFDWTEHYSLYIFQRKFFFYAWNFNVSVAMIGKKRFKCFFSTFSNINILRHGSPDILEH